MLRSLVVRPGGGRRLSHANGKPAARSRSFTGIGIDPGRTGGVVPTNSHGPACVPGCGELARFPLGWTTHSNGGRERVGEEVRDETGFNGSPPARGRRGRSRRRFTPADRPPIPRQPLGRRPVAPPAPPDRLLGTPTPGRRTSIRPRPRGH